MRWASERRSSTSTPVPSDHPVPSADSENGLHRPSGASPPPCDVKDTNADGVDITVAPPARASEHSPPRSACTAQCSATSDDEHPVSTVTAGPSSPYVYESRPEMTLAAKLVLEYALMSASELSATSA
ncbi:hypothetical protein GCM10022251_20790 [Phytohabitans flavus]